MSLDERKEKAGAKDSTSDNDPPETLAPQTPIMPIPEEADEIIEIVDRRGPRAIPGR